MRFSLMLMVSSACATTCLSAAEDGLAVKGNMQQGSSTIIVDRLVATVNNQPITQSEILWQIALDPAGPTGPPQPALYSAVLHQLIDLKLLDQEAEKLPANEITDADIDRYSDTLMKQFPSEAEFRKRLAPVGLTNEIMRERVRHRLEILHFIDFRFRAFVIVTPQEIEQYYQKIFVPSAREKGQVVPPLDQVSRAIERDLADQKVAGEMTTWFEEARRRSDIVVLYEP